MIHPVDRSVTYYTGRTNRRRSNVSHIMNSRIYRAALSGVIAIALAGIPMHARAAEPSPSDSRLELRSNPSVTHGVWEGWGTSLCWMGKVFGDRDDIADFLFTTKTASFNGHPVPGLGLNIGRPCTDFQALHGPIYSPRIRRTVAECHAIDRETRNPAKRIPHGRRQNGPCHFSNRL